MPPTTCAPDADWYEYDPEESREGSGGDDDEY